MTAKAANTAPSPPFVTVAVDARWWYPSSEHVDAAPQAETRNARLETASRFALRVAVSSAFRRTSRCTGSREIGANSPLVVVSSLIGSRLPSGSWAIVAARRYEAAVDQALSGVPGECAPGAVELRGIEPPVTVHVRLPERAFEARELADVLQRNEASAGCIELGERRTREFGAVRRHTAHARHAAGDVGTGGEAARSGQLRGGGTALLDRRRIGPRTPGIDGLWLNGGRKLRRPRRRWRGDARWPDSSARGKPRRAGRRGSGNGRWLARRLSRTRPR